MQLHIENTIQIRPVEAATFSTHLIIPARFYDAHTKRFLHFSKSKCIYANALGVIIYRPI